MPNVKKFIMPWSETGKTVYGIFKREADSFLLNDADGAFAAAPADPYVLFTEHVTIKGQYELSESRTAWNDGRYTVTAYKQAGASPSPVADTIIGAVDIHIASDLEVVLDSTVAKEATVNTRLASSAYTAPDNSSILLVKAKTDTINWTDVTSRLASSAYVIPDNSSILLVKAKTDTINWTDVTNKLDASAYVAPDNSSIVLVKAKTDTINWVDVTSRLASSAYIAPDNSSITLIKAKTDTINWLDIDRLSGLMLENAVEDDIIRDSNGNKTSSVIYLYNSAANATTHDKVTGLIGEYDVEAAYTANKMTLFKVIRVM